MDPTGRIGLVAEESRELVIEIPGVPPSVNSYVRHARGGHYVTAAAERFKADLALLAAGRRVAGDEYEVWITVTLGKWQRGDIDNFSKVSLDGLVEAGVIRSDAAVTTLVMNKLRGMIPATRMKVIGHG